jgi:hypothetical protein
MDVDSFFRSRRTAAANLGHPAFYLFTILNGAISAAILYWSLNGDKTSIINQIIQVQSGPARTLVIAFAVPALLRSKLFGGNGNAAVGVAAGYDYLRDRVLHVLNDHASVLKDQLATYYARLHRSRADLPAMIYSWVSESLRPFKTEKEIKALKDEFERIGTVKPDDPGYERYLRNLIRWAMDNAGIKPLQRRLGRLASPAGKIGGERGRRLPASRSRTALVWTPAAVLVIGAVILLILALRRSPDAVVLGYMKDIGTLRGTVEAGYPGWSATARQEGIKLADRIGSIREDQLKLGMRIAQHEYKGWALLIVAYSFIESTEPEGANRNRQIDYAGKAIEEFDLALKRMDEVTNRFRNGDKSVADVYRWMMGMTTPPSYDFECTRYLRVIAVAVIAHAGGAHTLAAVKKEWEKLDPAYRVKYPPAKNPYLAWAIDNRMLPSGNHLP